MDQSLRETATTELNTAQTLLRDRAAHARATRPEYTLVAVTTVLGTEVGVYMRGKDTDTDWSYLTSHRGRDVDALAAVLREQGAPVTVVTEVYGLNRGGAWQPTTSGFRSSPESEQLAARIHAMFVKADALDAEWANNDRWGECGAATLRREAEYAIERLKNLDPTYPVHLLRTSRWNRFRSR